MTAPLSGPHKSDWTAFLQRYADGDWPDADITSDSASSVDPSELAQNPLLSIHDYEQLLYPTVAIDDKAAKVARQFVLQHGYLPPPRAPMENRRLECIHQYDLKSADQLARMQQVVQLAGAYFPSAVVTYTQFDGKVPMFMGSGGNKALVNRLGIITHQQISPHASLCGHTVLLKEGLMFVPDLSNDFRFRSNPITQAGGKSYVGTSIYLPLDMLSQGSESSGGEEAETVGIGSLNVLFVDKPQETLTDDEEMVIRQLAKLLESQLRSTWEASDRSRQAKRRTLVARMIETTFVDEQKERQDESEAPTADAVRLLKHREEAFTVLACRAVEQLAATLDGNTGVSVFNLGSAYDKPHGAADQVHTCTLMAQHSHLPWTISDTFPSAILTRTNARRYFSPATGQSGLETSLPPDTASHLIMTFFSSDRPQLAIVATSRRPWFSKADASFIRTVGSILLARRVQDIAITADHAKTLFLSTMTHELRTPLHSLVDGAYLASRAVNANDLNEAKAAIGTVRTSAVALQTILNDILDFGKTTSIEANDDKVTADVDMIATVRKAIDLGLDQDHGFEPGFSLRLTYPPGEWRADVRDNTYIRIFLNGLTNAFKFCKNAVIEISLAQSGDRLVTTIHDHGRGMNPDDIPYLMQPFTKAHDHTPGTGLGLHIAQRLVREMGGELRITSEMDKGTIFKFTLPQTMRRSAMTATEDTDGDGADGSVDDVVAVVKELHLTSPSDPSPAAGKVKTPPLDEATDDPSDKTTPLRILVVDDNALCRRILTKVLHKCPGPIQTAEASNGQQAVDIFPTFAPHLVLTDVSMPIMDGVTSAQHMRRIAVEHKMAPCKIFAITGLGLSDPRLKAAGLKGSAGLDGWLVKGQDDMASITRIVADCWKVHWG